MDLFFPAYFDKPTDIRFAEQEADEHIELMLRQHWIVNTSWISISILMFLIPFLLVYIDLALALNTVAQVPLKVIFGLLILWYMFVLAYIIEHFLSWYFNIYIVTNQHLVDINFHSLLSKEVIESGIENVESASSKMRGIFSSLFNYGDVTVQTAAETQHLTFDSVPFPDKVVDRINDMRANRGGIH